METRPAALKLRLDSLRSTIRNQDLTGALRQLERLIEDAIERATDILRRASDKLKTPRARDPTTDPLLVGDQEDTDPLESHKSRSASQVPLLVIPPSQQAADPGLLQQAQDLAQTQDLVIGIAEDVRAALAVQRDKLDDIESHLVSSQARITQGAKELAQTNENKTWLSGARGALTVGSLVGLTGLVVAGPVGALIGVGAGASVGAGMGGWLNRNNKRQTQATASGLQ
ncbi:uncharacterized protein MONBRDRAFT_34562 [Monosiga brevicollis MX1]|uniref:t-SNARE coiled-coil homology domain-containing protein n=1 Tax=Monosiga brevicollis TaxID=81824 RepID=A9VCJ8_MONBE|nr:uncharacterized protein MONBRDRAFT_34562 [Monosiga brevicollis MX1]EDQ84798.1 predicted protein [Monosiga brevicollis MX1]|eukprot:XP_001750448.1 hypothetical protein [Monosiga brevicollis MX1]